MTITLKQEIAVTANADGITQGCTDIADVVILANTPLRIEQNTDSDSNTMTLALSAADKPRSGSVREILDLSSLYSVVDEDAVSNFLLYNQVEPLLEEAHDYLRYYFPKNDFVLRVNHDPEEAGFRHLSVSVKVEREKIDEEIQMLDKFRAHWWTESLNRIDGRVTVSLGF